MRNETKLADDRPEKLFRVIIVGLIAAQMLMYFFPWGRFYGEALDVAMSWGGFGAALGPYYSFLFVNLISLLYLVTYLGLLFYSKWARFAFVWVLLAGVIGNLLLGLLIYSSVEAALGYAVSLGEGFVLALAYFSNVGNKFIQ